ncbi:MAG: hypothetical protein ACR2KK_02195 [Acidimicrobiales bacterium]
MTRLRGVGLKLTRARDHLDALNNEIRYWSAVNPYRLDAKFDSKNLAYFPQPSPGYVVTIVEESRLPGDRLSAVIGDCIHNLRAALDHLAWSLVVAGNGTPNEGTYFPVRLDRLSENGKLRPLPLTGAVDQGALTIIEDLQPYNALDDPSLHELAILSELDNIDKHRFLNPVGMTVIQASISLSDPAGGALFHQFVPGTFKRDAAVAFFPFREDQGAMNVDGNLTPLIALDDFSPLAGQPISGVLETLIAYVATEVVRPLSRFL